MDLRRLINEGDILTVGNHTSQYPPPTRILHPNDHITLYLFNCHFNLCDILTVVNHISHYNAPTKILHPNYNTVHGIITHINTGTYRGIIINTQII